MNQSKDPKTFTDKEWKEKLSESSFSICRKKGTEKPFTGEYDDFYEKGTYCCIACGNEIFSSKHKYNSGSGWPSFFDVLNKESILLRKDNSLSKTRTEVVCSHCESHLGHLFNDGPRPTGKRFCINSPALEFKKQS